ncbi:MAG TPA: NAD-binding protein [Candidatus Dormibacteraeota bacterium]|nr:NAD-binding protein [Candidatus Dormibacteraeota bacterium]
MCSLDNRAGTAQDFTAAPKIMPMTYRSRLRLALIMLTSVMVVGSAGFHYIEGWGWFDGFYMTLTTMSTVGYGEIYPLSHVGRVFNSFLILASVLAGGFTIATVSQGLLEFEFGKVFGRRRMEKEIAKLSDHYIICGAGRVGRTVARELRTRGESCVIVEKDPARAQWAEAEKIPVIIGNASLEDNLLKARIERARGFVSAVSSDAENIYIVLTARGLRSDLKIIARASEEEATSKLLRAGATQVLSPYFFIGHRIVQLFLRPNVLDFMDVAFGTERLDVEIGEVPIPVGSALIGRQLGDPLIRQQAGVIVLAVKNAAGRMAFNPPPETALCAGDCMIVLGGGEQLKKVDALAGVP